MIVKWLDFSDLHFEYTNVDTVNIRDNLLSTISDKELDADFILMCGDFFYQGKTDESRIKAAEIIYIKLLVVQDVINLPYT